MTGHTHRAVGTCVATGLTVGSGQPPEVCLVVVGVAYMTSRFPDKIERPLGLDHRTVSHWPLLMLGLAALISFAVPLAAVEAAQAVAAGSTSSGRVERAAEPYAALIAVGFAVGTVMHIVGDALTRGGVPLLGPFDRKDRHLLPQPFLIYVHEEVTDMFGRPVRYKRGRMKGQVKKKPSTGDLAYRCAAIIATGVIVLAAYGPSGMGA